MAEARTHQAISAALCGQPLALEPGRAVSAETKFLGPVVTGQHLEAEAEVERSEGRKRWVKVVVRREGTPVEGTPVMEGQFLTVVPDRHILDGRGPAPR